MPYKNLRGWTTPVDAGEVPDEFLFGNDEDTGTESKGKDEEMLEREELVMLCRFLGGRRSELREPDSELDRRDGRGGRGRRKEAEEKTARKNKARDVIPDNTSDDTSNDTAEDETKYINDNNKDDKVDGQQSANPIKGMKKGINSKEGTIGPSRGKVKESGREEAKDQRVRQSKTQPTSTPIPLPQRRLPGDGNNSHRERLMPSRGNPSPIKKPVEGLKKTEGVKSQPLKRLETQ
ncbi:hypothetical protein NEUTE1DRAFT_110541 [Neurospora tetrasperma FGSC 2508]|uniref:Uncharacterized protein n=1 Tax=Neurospora tetrasperma (strain FGSC 2508 / ATCC MYA-4615 / P0657) TaxID=510951 RepID=F8MLL4_NEUT8|nr:uncharacterized protein NEUTE1DRAFT_110541 [Neurospora tetrasperma FGSC 2508]EGO58433.1 hypothetical protein NEUTE1DRAFT_110541 [Neurospora tetrasperma FGSC 2508]EGZ71234.1 hypothetical protein NEUTE2DRAFT_128631 [Neurospora tetrasperma FGSC 2509]